MPRGIVKCFNDAKGYGFITRDDGRDVFVHYSSIANTNGFRTLTVGQLVTYDEQDGARGLFAVHVTVMPDGLDQDSLTLDPATPS